MANLKLSTDLQNRVISGLAIAMGGTMGSGGTCLIRIYNCVQPVNADESTAGCTMLASIINLGWGSGGLGCTSGTGNLCSAGGMTGTCGVTGTAAWARLETYGTTYTGSAATFRIDGDVGTGATCAFVVNSVVMTSGGAVTLISMPLSIG